MKIHITRNECRSYYHHGLLVAAVGDEERARLINQKIIQMFSECREICNGRFTTLVWSVYCGGSLHEGSDVELAWKKITWLQWPA